MRNTNINKHRKLVFYFDKNRNIVNFRDRDFFGNEISHNIKHTIYIDIRERL